MNLERKRNSVSACVQVSNWTWLPAATFLALGLALSMASSAASTDTVLPVSREPHHHLKLANGYVQVYRVLASRGDDILMHQHEYDMISIQTGPVDTTVHYPNKPDVHQVIADGQVRYQLKGLVHSTEIHGPQPFRNVTIALLHPQTEKRNLCVAAIAGEPLHCAAPPEPMPGLTELPEMETDQTQIALLRVAPRAEGSEKQPAQPEVFVALDDAEITIYAGQGKKQVSRTLRHPGDFAWFDAAGPTLTFLNSGEKEARLVTVLLKPDKS